MGGGCLFVGVYLFLCIGVVSTLIRQLNQVIQLVQKALAGGVNLKKKHIGKPDLVVNDSKLKVPR